MSLRGLADKLELSAAYIHDVERGRRNALKGYHLKKACEILCTSVEERDMLYDLAGHENGLIAEDLIEYIKRNPSIAGFLRRAERSGKDNDWWRSALERWGNGN